MKIRQIYDQGSAEEMEDFPVIFPRKVLGVLDTGSAVSFPPKKPKYLEGVTGGQLLGRTIVNSIGANLGWYPAMTLDLADLAIKNFVLKPNGLKDALPSEIPFASYALAFLCGDAIIIICGGDCQFVWLNTDGTFGWTENQTLEYDRENLRLIANYMLKHNGNRDAMWQEFGPILKNRRNEYFNSPKGKFSILNGQDFREYWQMTTMDIDRLSILIGFTDGFVNQAATADMKRLAPETIKAYQNGGLQSILNNTRAIAEMRKNETHVTYPEATAIAIEL